jgi:CheY-like chemotaxis protein
MSKYDLVCIIDDNPTFVFGIQRLMTLADVTSEYIVFNDGENALNGLKSRMEHPEKLEAIPDVILLDLNMPVMDGWRFLDEFTQIQSPKKITIYIVSSSINPLDIERAKQYDEVKEYIIKPISYDDVKSYFL